MQNGAMTTWLAWKPASAPTPEQELRATLRAIWDLHAFYKDEQWLWRGQANSGYRLEPAIHTRVREAGSLADADVLSTTQKLISATRFASLDRHESTILHDLALLAMLQHHGAATPLLDVTLDPVVALYMAAFSKNGADDHNDGVVFAIKRPAARPLEKFDSRPFADIYADLPADKVAAYEAPDVSERLRIQRGLFLLAKVLDSDNATIPLTFELEGSSAASWVSGRLNSNPKGRPPSAKTDVAVFPVSTKIKVPLRAWLEKRSGMTTDFVFPTRWHQPHFEQFAHSHGRHSPL